MIIKRNLKDYINKYYSSIKSHPRQIRRMHLELKSESMEFTHYSLGIELKKLLKRLSSLIKKAV